MQVKLLNKLASARAAGRGGGSKVLTDLVDGLEEPGFAVELRVKIDQNHSDLKGGYVAVFIYCRVGCFYLHLDCNMYEISDLSVIMERQC